MYCLYVYPAAKSTKHQYQRILNCKLQSATYVIIKRRKVLPSPILTEKIPLFSFLGRCSKNYCFFAFLLFWDFWTTALLLLLTPHPLSPLSATTNRLRVGGKGQVGEERGPKTLGLLCAIADKKFLWSRQLLYRLEIALLF